MKTLFIESKYKGKVKINKKDIAKLPSKIGLTTIVQFVDNIEDIKKQLKGKKVFVSKGKQKYKAQILGCDVSAAEKIKNKVDAFLHIGDGRFHPIGLKLRTGKDVFVFNPLSNVFSKLDEKAVENYKKTHLIYKKRKKAALMKFYHANNVGVLISTKPGQKFGNSDKVIKKYNDKKFYKFIFDTLDIKQLENFPFIEAWINTACPRLDEDFNFLNINDLK